MPTTLYEAVIDWLEYSINKLNKKGLILKVKDKSGRNTSLLWIEKITKG